MRQIYADHNASTPLCPAAVAAVQEALDHGVGNPSAGHWAGRRAREMVERARAQVAAAFAVTPDRVVFTSGGTESDNHALRAALQLRAPRRRLLVSAIEHPAILDTARHLAAAGAARCTELAVEATGRVEVAVARSALDEDCAAVAIMLANNETGALQPVMELAGPAREHGALLICDAAQAVGKIPVSVPALGCDLLTLAGHKFGAPKGIGALLLGPGIDLPPLLIGGGHEGGRRPGTESTLLIAALGAACAALPQRLATMPGVARLRDRFEATLLDAFPGEVVVNAAAAPRLPNTASIAFVGRLGAAVLAALPELAASTGSACHDGRRTLSPVLRAMGVPEHQGLGTVRFSFGPETTAVDIDDLLALLRERLPGVAELAS